MAAKKCLKCGATIPDGSEFCPSCGAPKGARPVAQTPPPQQMQQPMQPMQQQTPMSMQKTSPLAGIFDMAFSKTGIIMGLAIGVLLAWIGVLIGVFSVENADIAQFMGATGFAIMGFQLASGGIWNRKIIPYARLGMVLIGGFILSNGLATVASFFGNLFN